jgi:hypothetical protein
MVRKSAHHQNESPRELEESEGYIAKVSASYEKDEMRKSRAGTSQNFFKKTDPVRGDVSAGGAVSEQFFDKSDADYGRDKYHRSVKGQDNEFAAQSEDITGKSVSGESEVANH